MYDGFRYGTVAEREKKSETVTKAVCTVLSGAGGSRLTAAEIIAKILRHPKLADAIEDTEDPSKKELKDYIIKQLLVSLAQLKRIRANFPG